MGDLVSSDGLVGFDSDDADVGASVFVFVSSAADRGAVPVTSVLFTCIGAFDSSMFVLLVLYGDDAMKT